MRNYLKYIKTQVIKTVKKCRFFHTNILCFHHLPENLHEGSFSSQRDDSAVKLTRVCLQIQCIRFSVLAVSPTQKKNFRKRHEALVRWRAKQARKCAGYSKNEEAQEIRCRIVWNRIAVIRLLQTKLGKCYSNFLHNILDRSIYCFVRKQTMTWPSP